MFFKTLVLIFGSFILLSTVNSLDLKRFGTKNPYHAIPIPLATLDEYSKVVTDSAQQCPAIHATGVYRHGARNPDDKNIDGINSVHDDLTSVSNMYIRNWQNTLTKSDALLLNTLGEAEMVGLGNRLAKRLSRLLSSGSTLKTEYISSDTQRTRESARYFYNGLSNFMNVGGFDLSVNEKLIKHYSDCAKYITAISNNEPALAEVNKFENGVLREQMVERIRSKLSLSNPAVIGRAESTFIYQYCAYESGLYNASAWCDLLYDTDVTVMEYLDDLKVYWLNAYGYALNVQRVCPLLSNIFKEMDYFVNGTQEEQRKTVRFMFGHTPTVMPLIAALGLYKDTKPLLANNMEQQANRELRSSSVMPFSANVVFVLYKCNATEITTIAGKDFSDTHMVRLFHNEEEVAFPGCRSGYCPYKFLREKYFNLIYKCNFDEMCTTGGSDVSAKLSLAVILSALILLHFF